MDVAAAFVGAGFGLMTVVPNASDLPLINAHAYVVSTNSRNDSSNVAREKVAKVLSILSSMGVDCIYKKIDSTLKGNWIAEMDVCGAVLKRPICFCPANPSQQRRVVNRVLMVRNQAIDISSLLCEPSNSLHSGISVSIEDASSDADLDTIVNRVMRQPDKPFLVGSAGLAAAVARWMVEALNSSDQATGGHAGPGFTPPFFRSQPALILIGSENPITERQVQNLVDQGQTSLFGSENFDLSAVEAELGLGKNVVLRRDLQAGGFASFQKSVATKLAGLAPEKIGVLIVSGGDTAEVALANLQVTAIEVRHREWISGLCLGHLVDGPWSGTWFATKPGGFGSENCLIEALQTPLTGVP